MPSAALGASMEGPSPSPGNVLATIQNSNWSWQTAQAKKVKGSRRGLASELEQENVPQGQLQQQQQQRPLGENQQQVLQQQQPQHQLSLPSFTNALPQRPSPLCPQQQQQQQQPSPRRFASASRQTLRPTPVAKGTPVKYSPLREKILGTPIRPSPSAQRSLLQDNQHWSSTPFAPSRATCNTILVTGKEEEDTDLRNTPPSSASPLNDGSVCRRLIIPKKRWLQEIFEQEQQQQLIPKKKAGHAENPSSDDLAQPITWEEEGAAAPAPAAAISKPLAQLPQTSRRLSRPLSPPQAWEVAGALVTLRGHPIEEEDQPLNLSLEGSSRA